MLRAIGSIAFLFGAATIILNPACPLWPANYVAERISNPKLKSKLIEYLLYSQRDAAARSLVAQIPESESKVGMIVQNGEPIAELWKPRHLKRKVVPLPPEVSRSRLEAEGISYLIVKHRTVMSDQKTLSSEFLENLHAQVIDQVRHTAYIQRGKETWYLVELE